MADPYSDFFLKSRVDVKQLELLELSHPDMTRVYRIVRNSRSGVMANIAGLGMTAFEYYPLKIEQSTSTDDLAQTMRIDIGDLGVEWPQQLEAIALADGFGTKPTLRYWVFRSDDMTTPLKGPLRYEVRSFSFAPEGASIEAAAPQVNSNGTGELYSPDRFQMLRGFL